MLHRWLLLHDGRWDSIPSREGFRSLFHFRLFFVRNYLLSIYLLFVIRFTNSEFQGLGWVGLGANQPKDQVGHTSLILQYSSMASSSGPF